VLSCVVALLLGTGHCDNADICAGGCSCAMILPCSPTTVSWERFMSDGIARDASGNEIFFNAPPSWNLPPDWDPPAGWRPDPSWAPPPAGWSVWIDENGNPAWPADPGWQIVTNTRIAGSPVLGQSTSQLPPPQGHPYPAVFGAPAYGQAPSVAGPYAQPTFFPYTPPAAQGTNGFSIAALVLGIVWLYGVGSILALVFGYVALGQVKRRGGAGRGMAIAGVVLGWVGIAGLILVVVIVFAIGNSTQSKFTNTP
jgi:hypothetical protein